MKTMKTNQDVAAVWEEMKQDLAKHGRKVREEVLPWASAKAACLAKRTALKVKKLAERVKEEGRARIPALQAGAFQKIKVLESKLRAVRIPLPTRKIVVSSLAGLVVVGSVGGVYLALSENGRIATVELPSPEAVVAPKAGTVATVEREPVAEAVPVEAKLAQTRSEPELANPAEPESPTLDESGNKSSDDWVVMMANLPRAGGAEVSYGDDYAVHAQALREQARRLQMQAVQRADEAARSELNRYEMDMAGRLGARGVYGY